MSSFYGGLIKSINQLINSSDSHVHVHVRVFYIVHIPCVQSHVAAFSPYMPMACCITLQSA